MCISSACQQDHWLESETTERKFGAKLVYVHAVATYTNVYVHYLHVQVYQLDCMHMPLMTTNVTTVTPNVHTNTANKQEGGGPFPLYN